MQRVQPRLQGGKAITAICYLAGLIVKASPWNNDKYIPIACGLVGGVLGVLALYTDGGYLLRELDVSGYARREMQGNVLVITNQPEAEPVPAPEPEPAVPTEMELAQQDITDLQLNDIEQGQQITDLELTILGGGTGV